MSRFVPQPDIPALRRTPFLFLLPAVVSGILLQYFFFSRLSSLPWLCLAWFWSTVALVLHLRHGTGRRLRGWSSATIWLGFFFGSMGLSARQDIRRQPGWYGHHLQQAEAMDVKVTGTPRLRPRTLYIPAQVKNTYVAGSWRPASGQISIYCYRSDTLPVLKPGQRLLIPARLVALKASGNPFSFDYPAYAARQGLYHQAFLSAPELVAWGAPGSTSGLQTVRAQLLAYTARAIADSNTRSLVEAIMLNERTTLDPSLWQAYSVTGIVHIIAISGMHVALLAGMVLFLLRFLPRRKLDLPRYLLATAVVWGYVALTGFPPSAVRAALMFTILIIGQLLRREGQALNTWAAAGLVLLCINPWWLFDVGVQLSFLAVLSILLFYRSVRGWLAPGPWPLRLAWEATAVSIAAQVLVFPLVLYYFHQFPLLGLLASVPAAIYSFLLMTGSLLLFLLSLLGVGCTWLGYGLYLLTQAFHSLIFLLAAWTPEAMRQLFIDRWEYLMLMLLVICGCGYLYVKNGLLLLSTEGILLLLIADVAGKDLQALRQERVIVYNLRRQSAADLFIGRATYPLSKATDAEAAVAIRQARNGLRAGKIRHLPKGMPLYTVQGARILFWTEPATVRGSGCFPVDFLIVSERSVFIPRDWYRYFRPRKIILDGSLPRWKAQQWRRQLEAMGAAVHWVQEDGAWSYPSLP